MWPLDTRFRWRPKLPFFPLASQQLTLSGSFPSIDWTTPSSWEVPCVLVLMSAPYSLFSLPRLLLKYFLVISACSPDTRTWDSAITAHGHSVPNAGHALSWRPYWETFFCPHNSLKGSPLSCLTDGELKHSLSQRPPVSERGRQRIPRESKRMLSVRACAHWNHANSTTGAS